MGNGTDPTQKQEAPWPKGRAAGYGSPLWVDLFYENVDGGPEALYDDEDEGGNPLRFEDEEYEDSDEETEDKTY